MKEQTKFQRFWKKLYKYRVYLLMLAPAVIYTLIFAYYPMTGVVMAFKKYNYQGGIWEVHGTVWRTSSSSLNPVRQHWLFVTRFYIIFCLS